MTEPELELPGDDALSVERIAIDRLDGISEPFVLDDFAPGINLVVGPNASGKSRTSVALQALLWPRTAEVRSDLSGRLAVAGDVWNVHVDNRDAQYMREGTRVDGPSLGGIPAEQRDRYLLTLHDLLQASNININFAREIQRESEGGYDLNQARTALKYPRSAPKAAARTPMSALRERRAEVNRLRSEDTALRLREDQLTTLDARIAAARAAQGRVTLLERALQHRDAGEERDRCRTTRDQFPETVTRMTGEEVTTLADLESQRETLRLEIRDAERLRDEARADLEATGFAGSVPDPELLTELRDRARRLRELDAEGANAAVATADLRSQLDRARTRLGASVHDDHLATLELEGLRELVLATRKAVEVESAYSAQLALYQWVGKVRPPGNIRQLNLGVDALVRRLQVVGQDTPRRPSGLVQLALIVAAVVIVIEAVLLGIEVAPLWYLVGLLALPVVWIAIRSQAPPGAAIAAEAEARFASLELEAPTAWAREGIEQRLTALRDELAKAEVDAEKVVRWRDLADRRADAEIAANDAEAARAAVHLSLGVADVDGDWTQVERLARDLDLWRSAGDALGRADARQAELDKLRTALVADINVSLDGFGLDPVSDATALDGRIAVLERRITAARDARSRIAAQATTIAHQLQPRRSDVEGRIARVYEAIGLEVGDALALRELSERVPAYRLATDALRDADTAVATIAGGLEAEPALRDREQLDLEEDFVATRELADTHDAVRDERARILSDVDHARRDTRLETAVDAEVKSKAALDIVRQTRYTETAQWRLGDFLHTRTRDLNRPAVFRAAQDLFARFTSGAFELEFSDDYAPKFQARKTASGETLDLDLLSSGTRLQLLMAVRIAFIEHLEHGFRLPLLLDEALGNTDDIRINAIMDATIELSRQGRQVIYFTAQREEIAKWRARLADAPDVTHRVFDLADIRNIAAAGQPVELSLESDTFTRRAVPDHLDHAAARNFFRVPAVDPWVETLDAAHVWYFFPDVPMLARLTEYGVVTWSQYVALRRRTLTPLIADLAAAHERAERRHRALAAALEFWRIGRCAPLDRWVLTDCRALTGSTRAPVLAAAEEVEWDGSRLIALLRGRRISHFTERRIDELESHLRERDHIVDGEPHPDRVVRAHALAAVDGELPVEEVDALLQALGMRFGE